MPTRNLGKVRALVAQNKSNDNNSNNHHILRKWGIDLLSIGVVIGFHLGTAVSTESQMRHEYELRLVRVEEKAKEIDGLKDWMKEMKAELVSTQPEVLKEFKEICNDLKRGMKRCERYFVH